MHKKILVIDSTYLGNKPNRERNVINMSYWVKEKNADLTIATTKAAVEFYEEIFDPEIFQKIKFIRLPFSKNFEPKGAIGVVIEYKKRILGTFKLLFELKENYSNIYALTAIFPDVIITYILKALKFRKSKIFVVFDNFVKKPSEREGSYFYNLIPYLSYRLSLIFIKKFDAVFTAMVENNLEKVFKMFGKNKNRIIPDKNGVNLELIKKADQKEKEYDILYIGRLHKDKGILDLLEVLGKIKKSIPSVKAFIAGPMVADIKKPIENKIKELDIQDNIEMVNHVGGLYKYEILKSAKTFCFFSYYESYPISVLEAMASQLKIFAYNLDIFSKDPFNLGGIETFEKGDFDEASRKITSFLKNPEWKEYMDINILDQNRSAELQYNNFI